MKARATGRTHAAMVLTKIGYGLSGLLGAGLIFIGARFLVDPPATAAGYGITNEQGGPTSDPYLAVKGVRDIAFGVVHVRPARSREAAHSGQVPGRGQHRPGRGRDHSAAGQRPEGNRLRGARHHGSWHARHGRAPVQRPRVTFLPVDVPKR